jgi:DNA invertase Pin-like site-specific DNA recombinase
VGNRSVPAKKRGQGLYRKPSAHFEAATIENVAISACGQSSGKVRAVRTKERTMRRAVFYLRVSTQDQTTANQERELRAVAERVGCEVVKVYKDHGISGAKGRDKRPAFDALCKDAARRQFDVVMAWSVDRLGRSLKDLIDFLKELHALKIDLFLHQQRLDTTTPAGKAMFQMMGVFAEFERAMIQERVRAGLARARAEGKKKFGRSRIDSATEKEIRQALRKAGVGMRKIAVEFGVGTVQRIASEMRLARA